MNRIIILTTFLITASFYSFCQNGHTGEASTVYAYNEIAKGYIVYGTVVNGDTLPIIHLNTLQVIEKRSLKSKKKLKSYNKLRRDVLKVYPLARVASAKLTHINNELSKINSKSEQKKLLAQMENDLFAEYEDEIRTMTFKQGRILIKLIDRETGNTSYNILEELKGKSSAIFWQAISRVFGSNLKWEYDPEEERDIEEIIKSI